MSQHFAIGLVAQIKKGAKPVGWADGEKFEDGPFVYEVWRQITDVAASDPGNPLGSFEVAGWYWAPGDITVEG